MLLNLSNHPSEKWSEVQLQIAIEKYGRVEDLSFPNVPPEAKTYEVDTIVEKYYNQIRKLDPLVVHIMGEMTFTFRLVNQLKETGYPCLASTTHRIVEEREGKKIVQFQFVQFREY